jgi:hypothetical protein
MHVVFGLKLEKVVNKLSFEQNAKKLSQVLATTKLHKQYTLKIYTKNYFMN